MVKATKGSRERTRQKFRKDPRQRGMPPVTRALQRFEVGEHAAILIDPSVHGGMPNKRFHGLTGTVVARQGRAYVVALQFGTVVKRIIAGPEHLRRVA